MKYRKQHTPPSRQYDDPDLFRHFLLGAFGGTSLGEIFPQMYEEPCDEESECPGEEEVTYAPEVEEALVRCAAIGYGRLKLPAPDSLIKHWGQGFLRQNVERFVRDYWDGQGELPKGQHQVGAHRIDFGQEE